MICCVIEDDRNTVSGDVLQYFVSVTNGGQRLLNMWSTVEIAFDNRSQCPLKRNKNQLGKDVEEDSNRQVGYDQCRSKEDGS